ncbi:hypothetical protein CRUP_027769 [Coryphaenoides rupestris]|nr:hypothetical protein CRUP_027769 [Coryphaenoides rupestris]
MNNGFTPLHIACKKNRVKSYLGIALQIISSETGDFYSLLPFIPWDSRLHYLWRLITCRGSRNAGSRFRIFLPRPAATPLFLAMLLAAFGVTFGAPYFGCRPLTSNLAGPN